MASTWLAAAAMTAALSAPGALSNETSVTAPPAPAPFATLTPVALTQRAPARWRTAVCAGVTGIGGESAQYVVDRVSQRARELGLRVGAPGCSPNLLVVFSDDPDGQARSIARERSDPASATGISGETMGQAAFQEFLRTDRPIRWWRVTRPVVDTGQVAARDVRNGEAPRVNVTEPGRLASTTRAAFSHVIVIADMAQVNGKSLGALADYMAMVALAPVELMADSNGYPSILGMFADNAPATEMTAADEAYLREIYR